MLAAVLFDLDETLDRTASVAASLAALPALLAGDGLPSKAG